MNNQALTSNTEIPIFKLRMRQMSCELKNHPHGYSQDINQEQREACPVSAVIALISPDSRLKYNQGLFFSSDRMMQGSLTKPKLGHAGGTVAGFVEAMPAGAALHGDGVCKEF